jgi:hypothetical protein
MAETKQSSASSDKPVWDQWRTELPRYGGHKWRIVPWTTVAWRRSLAVRQGSPRRLAWLVCCPFLHGASSKFFSPRFFLLLSASERADYADYKAVTDPAFLLEMHKEIRAGVFKALEAKNIGTGGAYEIVLLQGGTTEDFELYCSDTDKTEFRQEAFFRYLFQVPRPVAVLDGSWACFCPTRTSHLVLDWAAQRRQCGRLVLSALPASSSFLCSQLAFVFVWFDPCLVRH